MSLTRTKAGKEESEYNTGSEKRALVEEGSPLTGERAERPRRLRSAFRRRRLASTLFRSLAAVLVGSLILRLASQSMGQMVQFYLAQINRDYYEITYIARGFITASFFVTEMVGAIVLGALSDRYGRRLFIILGPLLGAIAVQITSMTVVIWLLVFTRLLEGLSTASSVPATLGYISEATVGRPKLRARIVGLFDITLVGGIAAGGIVGGYLWKFFSEPAQIAGIHLISPAFSLNGLIYLGSLAIFAWGLSDIRRSANGSTSSHGGLRHYREIMKSPGVWRFVPAWLAIFAIIGMWTNHSPGLMTGKEHHGSQLLAGNIAPEHFGNGFAILATIFALGVLGWSFYLNRYRKTSVMIVATAGLFTTLFAVYGLNHLGSFSSPVYYPLMLTLIVSIVVLSGFTPAALTYLADVTESYRQDRGSIMGLYSVFLGIGQFVGITTGGFFAQWAGIDGLLLLSTIFGVLTIYTLVALRKTEIPDA
jgi:MFS family permease